MAGTVISVIESCLFNIYAAITEMDKTHLKLVIAVCIFLCLLLGVSVILTVKKKAKCISGILAGILVAFALLLCIVSSSRGILLFAPSSQPGETVYAFMDAWCTGDTATAAGYLSVSGQLFDGTKLTEDYYANIFNEALTDSYSYSVSSDNILDGKHAYITVSMNYLALNDMLTDIRSDVLSDLDTLSEECSPSEIADDDDNFLPEVLESVYYGSVNEMTASAENYYKTANVTLDLLYRDGKWVIAPNDELSLCFTGGVSQIDNFSNNAKSTALEGLIFIPRHYTLPEETILVPAPIETAYGDVLPEEVENLLPDYARLIDDRDLFFDPEANFTDSYIHYYGDETIFVLTWKELFNNHSICCSEVFIADPSQFRRKLANDTYGSSVQKNASDLAVEANAVVAMNGDFYKFRAYGITVYDRELYRFNPGTLDCCHINSSGDLVFTYKGELTSEEQTREFIKDNDILFSLTFGPVLVDGGEIVTTNSYMIGEVNDTYSRSAIGQTGSCHYFLMTINYGYGTKGATIMESAQIMYDKGCENAYALDGGQTAEIVWKGVPYNFIDYGNERAVSDIIYFATALPEEDR